MNAAAHKEVRNQEEHIKRLKQDTYKVRKLEGRPKHGTSSIVILSLGACCWLIQAGCLAVPEWRSTWTGVMGYPHRRGWGLFAVSGRNTVMHHEMAQTTCRFFAELNVGGICASPICLWYRLKCQTYIDMMIYCYCLGFMAILEMCTFGACLFWTAKLNPRSIRWASIWWLLTVFLHLIVLIGYYISTEMLFDTLDSKSFYPPPMPGMCCIGASFTCISLIIVSILGIKLKHMWPELDLDNFESTDESDEDEDDESDSSEDGAKKKKKKKKGAQQDWQEQGYDPGYQGQQWAEQPQGYGQGYDPALGYDPSQNYGLPAPGTQPGYDASGGWPQEAAWGAPSTLGGSTIPSYDTGGYGAQGMPAPQHFGSPQAPGY